MAREFTVPRGEDTTDVLLNGHTVKLHSKFKSLFPLICIAPRPHQKSAMEGC